MRSTRLCARIILLLMCIEPYMPCLFFTEYGGVHLLYFCGAETSRNYVSLTVPKRLRPQCRLLLFCIHGHGVWAVYKVFRLLFGGRPRRNEVNGI